MLISIRLWRILVLSLWETTAWWSQQFTVISYVRVSCGAIADAVRCHFSINCVVITLVFVRWRQDICRGCFNQIKVNCDLFLTRSKLPKQIKTKLLAKALFHFVNKAINLAYAMTMKNNNKKTMYLVWPWSSDKFQTSGSVVTNVSRKLTSLKFINNALLDKMKPIMWALWEMHTIQNKVANNMYM